MHTYMCVKVMFMLCIHIRHNYEHYFHTHIHNVYVKIRSFKPYSYVATVYGLNYVSSHYVYVCYAWHIAICYSL